MSHRHPSGNFWEWAQSFDPNTNAPGRGVDHGFGRAGPEMPSLQGFPFSYMYRPNIPQEPWHIPEGGWQGNYGESWGPRGHGGHHRARGVPTHGPQAAPTYEPQPEQTRHVPAAATSQEAVNEKDGSPDTMNVENAPDPEEVAPEEREEATAPPPYGRGRGFGRRFGPCHRGRGRCGPGAAHRGFRWGPPPPPPPGPHGHAHHGPPPPGSEPFDFTGMMRAMADQIGAAFSDHIPNYHQREFANQNSDDAFSPPLDIFNTERAYVLHLALPGAKKEDIGVDWDPETNTLHVGGVVHRPGDEAFLETLTTSERRVGVFERSVKLPPVETEAKDEIDGFGITAKMENGILVVTVPKAEKEWTEIHKVDIE